MNWVKEVLHTLEMMLFGLYQEFSMEACPRHAEPGAMLILSDLQVYET